MGFQKYSAHSAYFVEKMTNHRLYVLTESIKAFTPYKGPKSTSRYISIPAGSVLLYLYKSLYPKGEFDTVMISGNLYELSLRDHERTGALKKV